MESRATFSVADIPVRVTPMFFLISVVMSRADTVFVAVAWTLIVFVSILVHELGHAFAMRRFGGMPSIELHGMGGTTFWNARETLTHGKSVLVSLAGPFAGFALGFFVIAVGIFIPPANDEMAFVFQNLVFVNIAWGIFQLLPIVPLDGGHVLRALVAMRWPKQAEGVADIVTVITGTAVVGLSLYFQQPWPAILIALVAFPSFLRMKPFFERLRDGATFMRVESFFRAIMTSDAPADAVAAERLVAEAKTGAGKRAAAEALIWARLDAREAHAVDVIVSAYFARQSLASYIEARIETAQRRPGVAITRLERHALYRQGSRELYAYVEACIAADEPERCVEALVAPGGELDAEGLLARFTARWLATSRVEEALACAEIRHLAFEGAGGSFDAARCLTRLARTDEAFAALEETLTRKGAEKLDLRGDPDLAPLRDDPRWLALIARTPRAQSIGR